MVKDGCKKCQFDLFLKNCGYISRYLLHTIEIQCDAFFFSEVMKEILTRNRNLICDVFVSLPDVPENPTLPFMTS